MINAAHNFSTDYRGLLIAKITAVHTPTSGPLSGRKVYEWIEQTFDPMDGTEIDALPPRKGVYTSATVFHNCLLDPNDTLRDIPISATGRESFVWARMKGAVTGITVYETASGGGASDWKLARVSAQHGGKPPRYTCVGITITVDVLSNPPTFTYGDKTPTETYLNCFRSPSRRWDELSGDFSSATDPVLRKINIDQAVLVRQIIPPFVGDTQAVPPTFSHDGAYEMTPWGGTRGATLEIPYRVCTQCIDTGSGVFKLRTRIAIRKRAIYARDLRVLKKPPATGEVNVEADVPNSGPSE